MFRSDPSTVSGGASKKVWPAPKLPGSMKSKSFLPGFKLEFVYSATVTDAGPSGTCALLFVSSEPSTLTPMPCRR